MHQPLQRIRSVAVGALIPLLTFAFTFSIAGGAAAQSERGRDSTRVTTRSTNERAGERRATERTREGDSRSEQRVVMPGERHIDVQRDRRVDIQPDERADVRRDSRDADYERDRNLDYEQGRNAESERGRNAESERDRNADYERGRNAESERDRNADYERERSVRREPPPRRNVQVRPRVVVDVDWPWVHRHRYNWSPRYRYRQVVYVDAGWGGRYRESRLDLRTTYRHTVRSATARRAEIDVYLERIEVFENGRFVGEVRRIPSHLARTRATVHRNGRVWFDRDLMLVGDPYSGFELISTRHYDGFIFNHYRRSHGFQVGVLDLRRERVIGVRESRLFDPIRFTGLVPVHLLPEDAGWMIDYGHHSYSGTYWGEDERYYYGYGGGSAYSSNGGYTYDSDIVAPRGATSGRGSVDADVVDRSRTERSATSERTDARGRISVERGVTSSRVPLERSDAREFETDDGAQVRIRRDTSIELLE